MYMLFEFQDIQLITIYYYFFINFVFVNEFIKQNPTGMIHVNNNFLRAVFPVGNICCHSKKACL